MFEPPSSPPPALTSAQHNDVKSVLLPAFGQDSSNDVAKKTSTLVQPREFVKPNFKVYRDKDASQEQQHAILPTPLPTSEANAHDASPPPSSPQKESRALESSLNVSSKTSDRPANKQMLLVRVPAHGPAVTVGRSSKSSDFAVRASNRLASRKHARLSVNSDENLLMVECLGWNGLSISVPTSTDASIESDEYQVSRGQILNIECIPGITMNVHGDKAYIEIFDDNHASEATEDESWSHINPAEAFPTSEEVQPPLAKRIRSHPSEVVMSKRASPIPEEKIETVPKHETLEAEHLIQGDLKNNGASEDPKVDAESGNSAESSRAEDTAEMFLHTKLEMADNATAQFPKKNSSFSGNDMDNQENVSISWSNSRVSSVEPSSENQGRKSRRTAEPISDQLKLEMGNVIVNNVAFSRQSAVPFGSIRRANPQFQNYSKSQLQEFIRSLDCIGVIEGGVEDTTGRKAEDEYYYIPQKDKSEERRNAVQNCKGHRSLRNCRKTPKQYFYRPLNLN